MRQTCERPRRCFTSSRLQNAASPRCCRPAAASRRKSLWLPAALWRLIWLFSPPLASTHSLSASQHRLTWSCFCSHESVLFYCVSHQDQRLPLLLCAGGVPGWLRRPAAAAALHERTGQRADPRHPRRQCQRTPDCHGHGIHFLHHTLHLTHVQCARLSKKR